MDTVARSYVLTHLRLRRSRSTTTQAVSLLGVGSAGPCLLRMARQCGGDAREMLWEARDESLRVAHTASYRLVDRNNLTLWYGGEKLIHHVAGNCSNTVVVLHTVGAIEFESFYDHENVSLSSVRFGGILRRARLTLMRVDHRHRLRRLARPGDGQLARRRPLRSSEPLGQASLHDWQEA